MSTWPIVQFVDAPDPSATVRYDFNDADATAPRRVDADFTLGAPSLDGDPDSVGASWGFRAPTFGQRVKGPKAAALEALQELSRELLRRTNWLHVKLDSMTPSVWLKIYRSGFQPLSLARVYVKTDDGGVVAEPDTWEIPVQLIAEAFGYGEREVLPTYQIVQSPADLTSPTRTAMRVVLPPIKGDAPTGLRVSLSPAATSNAGSKASWLVGCVSGKTTMVDPVIDIGTSDGFTAGAGTAAPTTDAAYFNGSYRNVVISTGANLLERLSGSLPAVPVGRFKVLVRYEADSTTGADKPYLFQCGTGAIGAFPNVIYAPSVPVTVPLSPTATLYRGWVDVGDFALPRDIVTLDTPDVLPDPIFQPYISVKIGTSDGSAGSVRIDAIKLIPLDGDKVSSAAMLNATWVHSPPINASGVQIVGVFDADSESYWATLSGNRYPSLPSCRGGFPIADPAAAQNLLVLVAMNHGIGIAAATASTTTKNAQVAVDISYYPRLLNLGHA